MRNDDWKQRATARMRQAGFEQDEIEEELHWMEASRELIDAPSAEPMRRATPRAPRVDLGQVEGAIARFHVDGCDVEAPAHLRVNLQEARMAVKQARRSRPQLFVDGLRFTSERRGELEYEVLVSPVAFERIRRITGYLVGTTARFNNAKAREEADRVKHALAS